MSGAFTSDGEARPNEMTINQWLDYVIDSDQVTRVTQHLALLVFALAVRQQKNGVSASVRDLERMTGWSKSMIADHLDELKDAIHMTAGVGRRKSVFELQSLIADAVKDIASPIVVSANTRTLEQNSVRECADAIPDAIPDTTAASGTADAIPDDTPSVRPEADATADATAPRERENKTEREKALPVVQVNCTAIHGPGFTLDFGAVDMAASLSGVPIERARQIAEICARDWAANGTKPSSPMAMVKRAIASDRNHKQTDDARVERAAKSTPASKRERIAQWAREEEERLKAEKSKWSAR